MTKKTAMTRYSLSICADRRRPSGWNVLEISARSVVSDKREGLLPTRRFSIVVAHPRKNTDPWGILVRFVIDGRHVCSEYPQPRFQARLTVANVEEHRDGKTYLCPMRFGRLVNCNHELSFLTELGNH